MLQRVVRLKNVNFSLHIPEGKCLNRVAERFNFPTARLVIISIAVDHDLLKLEIVHVFGVDLRRHAGRHFCSVLLDLLRRSCKRLNSLCKLYSEMK